MSVSRTIARSSTPIDTLVWTPIVVPAGVFNHMLVQVARAAAGDVDFRTDDGDASTTFRLQAGVQLPLDGTPAPGLIRFVAGESVLWAKAVAGTGPVECIFR